MRSLGVQPSEFWRMPPRHFRWLLETMEPPKKPGITDEERVRIKALVAKAKREAGLR